MIAPFLLLQALAAADAAPTLAAIGRQELPAAGCAAFLWSPLDRRLVAMATAEPASLRLSPGGKLVDLARGEGGGANQFGLPATATYRAGDLVATLEMTVTTRADLTDGGLVPQATLRLDQPGRDTLIMPVAGVIGCRKPPA